MKKKTRHSFTCYAYNGVKDLIVDEGGLYFLMTMLYRYKPEDCTRRLPPKKYRITAEEIK